MSNIVQKEFKDTFACMSIKMSNFNKYLKFEQKMLRKVSRNMI